MPQPIICLDEEVRHFAERFRAVFSKPQYQYFVTVLLGLMECERKRTLSGILSKVGEPPSLSGVSRFFSEAPWVQEALVVIWLEHFRAEMQPLVEAEREQQRQHQPKRRSCPKQPLVTGYVIGDDSTMSKPKGRKMQDWASTTRPPMTNALLGTVWCKNSTCYWIARVPWLRSCTVRPGYARPKRCRSRARSS